MGIWNQLLNQREIIIDELNASDFSIINNFTQNLNQMLTGNKKYSIGFHDIGMHGVEQEASSLSESFFNHGIKTQRISEQGGVPQVVAILGNSSISKKVNLTTERLYYMSKIEGRIGGCIVAIPEFLENNNGEKYSLGLFPDGLDHSVRDYLKPSQFPISMLFNKTGVLPQEFILGMVYKGENNEICLETNPNFVSILSKDEQSNLLNHLFSKGLPPEKFVERFQDDNER